MWLDITHVEMFERTRIMALRLYPITLFASLGLLVGGCVGEIAGDSSTVSCYSTNAGIICSEGPGDEEPGDVDGDGESDELACEDVGCVTECADTDYGHRCVTECEGGLRCVTECATTEDGEVCETACTCPEQDPPPCDGEDCEPPPCDGEDCAPPPCDGEDCEPPPCDGEDCAPPPCDGEDCAPPPCDGEDCEPAPEPEPEPEPCDGEGCSV
jgi:hypothetical protein